MPRILVVDDDPTIRVLTRKILERHGHTVEDAADGKTGLAAFRARPFDLLITDMEMPGTDGVEVIETLAKEYKNCPVIAMSGAPDSAQYLYLASFLGAGSILTKPFTPVVLLTAVDQVLARGPTDSH